MLNKNNERELAYVVKIGWVQPIEGADNIELVGINGWTCIAKKGEFKDDDLAVYFEIDSKLPAAEWSAFMESKHYKVKTMKLNKFHVVSQGLALPFEAFGWMADAHKEGDFLTKELGVTYADPVDNVRKSNVIGDKYKKMAARHPKLFQNPVIKRLYKTKWGKRVLFIFFGRKKDTRKWPAWVVKTDEERIQNMPWILKDKSEWFATEKVDGTSTTFTLHRKRFGTEYYVCSRNVVFDTPEKATNCFYNSNVYLEMSEKYNVESVLKEILAQHPEAEFVTLQAETYGKSIQKREYGLQEHDMMAFNLIFGFKDGHTERWNPREMTDYLAQFGIPCVPIVDEHFVLPDTVEELLTIATGKSAIDGGMREGLVCRSIDGVKSFKAVSNEFLLKYHNG